MPSAANLGPKPRAKRAATKTKAKATSKTRAASSRKERPKRKRTSSTTAAKKTKGRTSQRRKAATPSNYDETPAPLSPEERYRRIQDAAYFIAERHEFQGDPISFWLEAEREVDGYTR
ncbi:MAG: DUF2934 domain-containing protein [Deltaproteobacteria bacterium]|nr:DUF2934 domain-containing protein [Deltaproteobacteria bacterium]MBW2534041.1 DUF2934 domain-containing protein [Deltaproteobacteria bacterium]